MTSILVGLYNHPDPAINSPANVEAMVHMAQANGIHVILATIPPWGCDASQCTLAESADSTLSRYDRINTWNAWIEQYALSKGIPVVDYHSALLAPDGEHYVPDMTMDGVHPSAAGYVVMTPMVECVINAIVKPLHQQIALSASTGKCLHVCRFRSCKQHRFSLRS